jgi:hypothetical protein
VVANGEFLLRQFQSAANDLCLRSALHPFEIGWSQRLRIAVGTSRGLNGFVRHGPKRFAGNSLLAHFALPFALK